jgi:menaquinone-dependent protoporphyrinogen oxidase
MTRALIIYGTTEGQTAKIAQHLAHAGRRLGHGVDVLKASEIPEGAALDGYSAVLVGGSLHEGRYQREVARFVEQHKRWLHDRRLSGFFSVSLGAASRHADEVADVERMMEAFGVVHGWLPDMTASFAGALKYTQYNWLKRALMRHVARNEGGSTDTTRDHEYTDWKQVDRFARRFFGEL